MEGDTAEAHLPAADLEARRLAGHDGGGLMLAGGGWHLVFCSLLYRNPRWATSRT
jgi:hypothetical protein